MFPALPLRHGPGAPDDVGHTGSVVGFAPQRFTPADPSGFSVIHPHVCTPVPDPQPLRAEAIGYCALSRFGTPGEPLFVQPHEHQSAPAACAATSCAFVATEVPGKADRILSMSSRVIW